MPLKDIYIFVEGLNDIEFVNKILKPLLKMKYREVYPIPTKLPYKYGRKVMDIEKINSFVNNFRNRDDAEYIFMIDFDGMNYPNPITIEEKKDELIQKIPSLDNNRHNILIVVEEIESWYLAGLDTNDAEFLQIPDYNNTEEISKEKFFSIIPSDYDELEFRLELLERFKVPIAVKKNKSFSYFSKCSKWC